MSELTIAPLDPSRQATALAAVARAEGFRFLDGLIAQWEDGSNRFEAPGEALFGAFLEGRLVGTAGLNWQRAGVGRVRRVYVHPEARRLGVARALVGEVLRLARESYGEVVLYTETREAAALYERLGFRPEAISEPDHATHRLVFAAGEGSSS